MGSGVKGLREFGGFRLDVQKQVLWHEGAPVSLPLKEIEILCVLTENSGELVTKNELLETVWADSFVEESNLSRHIYLLRKTFKDFGESEDLIQTVPRRGYRFTGEVRESGAGVLVIEKHTLTQTLVEGIHTSDAEAIIRESPKTHSLTQTVLKPSRLLALSAILIIIATASIILWRYNQTNATSISGIKSIAVLPVKNLTGNSDNDALADGVTESIMTELSKVHGLKVISSTSVFSFKNKEADSTEIGRKLGVGHLLEGSLRRNGDTIRVETRLVKAENGEIIWNETYERQLEEIIVVQDRIACLVAAELKMTLCGQKDYVPQRYTENVKAYQAYMKGRFYWYQRGDTPLSKAITAFEEALQHDPNYALAYAGLAETYIVQEVNAVVPPGTALPKAVAHAKKALQLDPSLAGAYATLGLARVVERDFNGAEEMYQQAVNVNPNYATAWQWRSNNLRILGRFDEAETAAKKAQELDPLSIVASINLGQVYISMRRPRQIFEQAQYIFDISSDDQSGYLLQTYGYELAGNYDEALVAAEKTHALNAPTLKACILARAGRHGEALKIASELDKSEIASRNPYFIANIYALLDEKDNAFAWLDKAYESRQFFLNYINVEPRFDSIRSDPRYQEILRKINLE